MDPYCCDETEAPDFRIFIIYNNKLKIILKVIDKPGAHPVFQGSGYRAAGSGQPNLSRRSCRRAHCPARPGGPAILK
jgi:hypothetical protein